MQAEMGVLLHPIFPVPARDAQVKCHMYTSFTLLFRSFSLLQY